MPSVEPRSETHKRSRTRKVAERAAESRGMSKKPLTKNSNKQQTTANYRASKAKSLGDQNSKPNPMGIVSDVNVIVQSLSKIILTEKNREIHLAIARSIQEIMSYDITKDEIWNVILQNHKNMRLYTCDPDPTTFSFHENIVEGRGNILLSYETQVLPGIRDEMSVSLPARFKVKLEENEPRVISVQI